MKGSKCEKIRLWNYIYRCTKMTILELNIGIQELVKYI